MYHQYAKGGKFENENADMLKNQVQNLLHHANELSELMSNSMDVEPWVITKAQRAVTDLADITHYLEGEREAKKEYAEGGQIALFGYADGGRMQTKPKFFIEDSDGNTFYLHFDAKNERNEIRFDKDPARIYMYDSREEAEAVKGKLEQYGYTGLFVRSNTMENGGIMAKGGKVKKTFNVGDKVVYVTNGGKWYSKGQPNFYRGEIVKKEIVGKMGIENYTIERKNAKGEVIATYTTNNLKEIDVDPDIDETMAAGGKVSSYGLSFSYDPTEINKKSLQNIIGKYTQDWDTEWHDENWEMFHVDGLSRQDAEKLAKQLKDKGVDDIEIENARPYVLTDADGNVLDRPLKGEKAEDIERFTANRNRGMEFDTYEEAKIFADKLDKKGIATNIEQIRKYADGGMMDEDDEYGTFEMMKRGGNVEVEIVNQSENFDEDRYEWMLEDFDKDGVANSDDSSPLNKRDAKKVDNPGFSKAMTYLLDLKGKMDDNMYSFVDDLKDIAPDGSKIYARTKTPYSILNKLVTKRLMHPKSGLTDLIGTTITTSSKEELDAVRDEINSGELGKVIEFEDMYENPKQGYRAYHFLVERNGMPVEVQLKTKRQKAINQISHEAYKEGKLDGEKLLHISAVADNADLGDTEAIREYQEFMSQPDVKQAFYMAKGGKMAKGGIAYPSLSDEKPMIVQDSKGKKKAEGTEYLPEIKIILENDDRLPADKAIQSSNDAYNAFWRIWDQDSINVNENMYVLFLKQNNKPKGYSFHSKGAISATIIDPEIIAAQALKSLSKGIIIAHNHPSGNIEPSRADIEMANKLREGLKLFGINMLDSLILTPTYGKYRSMEESGDLNVSTRKWERGGEMAKGGKTHAMTKIKWYWVLGDHINGFKIVSKKPRTKFVPEPFDDLENAKRWIAMQFLLNA